MSQHGLLQRSALVLYGSETGNAQDVAEELGRVVQRLHFSSMVASLDSTELTSLSKFSVVLIATSTTGQGAVPANAKLFWRQLLRKKLPSDYFSDVKFALFGLGDSSYPKFNWAALKLFKRLVQLGADPIVSKGEGDEQHPEGIDSIYIPWATTLREKLLELYPLPEGLEPIPETVLLQPQWLLGTAESNGDATNDTTRRATRTNGVNPGTDLEVTLAANDRVTAQDHFQDVRHIRLESNQRVDYAPGDILTIYPQNAKEDVDQTLQILGWTDVADVPLRFNVNSQFQGKITAPSPSSFSKDGNMTLRSLLTKHLDLNAIPRRSFFSLIMHFTTDEFQKIRLQEFTDPQYTDELFDYTTRPRRSILEVLQEFDTLKIPWAWAATVIPPMRGRQFSISSGGKLKSNDDNNSTCFELLVAIVKYKTVIRKIRRGTCTRYLESLPLGSQLNVTLVKGTLGISSADLHRPIVMISPGTGVAPMRSLIWERLQWQRNLAITSESTNISSTDTSIGTTRDPNNQSTPTGQNLLIFGSRSRHADFFFANEWDELKQALPLTVLPAFSREQEDKVYVQDVVRRNAALICNLVHQQDAIVYVCGSSGKMPLAVREALVDVFTTAYLGGRRGQEEYLRIMEKDGRYKQETW